MVLKLLILLFLSLSLYADYDQWTEPAKHKLLTWVNQNCEDHHETFESFEQDRYFLCDKQAMRESNFIDFEYGRIGFTDNYAFGLTKHKFKSFYFYVIVYFVIPLLILLSYYLVFNKLWPKKYLIILFLVPVYFALKELVWPYSINVLLNAPIEKFKTFVPLYYFTSSLNNRRESALGFAIQSGYLNKVKYLVEELHYDPNEPIYAKLTSKRKELPYEVALQHGAHNIAQYLKTFLPPTQTIELSTAAKSFDMEMLVNSFNITHPSKEDILEAFIISIRYKDHAAMQYLYEQYPVMIELYSKEWHETPLQWAIKVNDFEAIKFLVEHNATINLCGTLSEAAAYDRDEILDYLIDKGGDVYMECKGSQNVFSAMQKYKAFLHLDDNNATKVERLLMRRNLMPPKEHELLKRKQPNVLKG